jgi:hypothetical protein
MEPFRLDRQAKAFLAVLVALALVLIPLAPFASLVLAGLSLVVLCLVLLMALARNRRFFGPLTKVEGALAVSAAVFAVAGALVIAYATIMLGARNAMLLSQAMLPFSSPDTIHGDSSTWFSDPETMRELKEELARAGVPFRLETREGKEYVTWSHKYEEKASVIRDSLRGRAPASEPSPLPPGRAMSFHNPSHHDEFAAWLASRGIKSRTVEARGSRFLVWDDGAPDSDRLVSEFMAERAKKCKEAKKTAQAPGLESCS